MTGSPNGSHAWAVESIFPGTGELAVLLLLFGFARFEFLQDSRPCVVIKAYRL